MTYSIALAAQSDIEDIVTTLWDENPKVAEAIEDRLYQAFDLLADNPRLGHLRPDFTDRPVLFWPIKQTPYAAIYKPATPIEIIRVIHWRREIGVLLSGDVRE